jgi:phytoene/squalene synthetase
MTSDMRSSKTKDAIGISFPKVNFLRDLKDDNLVLNRNYFPGVDLNSDENAKKAIINEIEEDFRVAYEELLNYLLRLSLVFIPLLYIIKNCLKIENTPVRK